MDPISVITTVYAIAMGLTQWIDDRKDKGETLKRLSGTVARVCDALRLLQSVPIKNSVDQSVTDSVKSLGDTLRRTQERLLLYGNKRSRNIIAFISPSTITSQLKEDERQLNNQLIIIIFCMTAMGYLKSLNDNAVMPVPVTAEPPVLASISNADVKEFWRDYVGGKLSFSPNDTFIRQLKLWAEGSLSDLTCATLLIRLDPFGVGGVTPSNLDLLCGDRSLKETFRMFAATGTDPSYDRDLSVQVEPKPSEPPLPMLLWIDDYIENIQETIDFARNKGVHVVHLESTALAKAWIDSNHEFLWRHRNGSQIHVITDNERFELDHTDSTFLDLGAGEKILRYLRGRRYTIPVLVYCGSSIISTRYVLDYEMAGSTSDVGVCEAYISELVDGPGDRAWRGFDVLLG